MPRFKIAHDIGKNLTVEEINKLDLKDKTIKIIDTHEKLPDLIVNDVDTARKYIDYMNRPQDEKKITDLVLDIRGTLEKLNNLNQALIQPEKIIIGEDEEGEPIYNTPLKEELLYLGYIHRVNNYNSSINRKLTELKNKLLEK